MARRLPLQVRSRMNLTEAAHARLTALNETYGLGNNHLLVVLLERLDDYFDPGRLKAAFEDFITEYGAPAPKGHQTGGQDG